jgi:hypothetical protein
MEEKGREKKKTENALEAQRGRGILCAALVFGLRARARQEGAEGGVFALKGRKGGRDEGEKVGETALRELQDSAAPRPSAGNLFRAAAQDAARMSPVHPSKARQRE